jgi:hypothetical protein
MPDYRALALRFGIKAFDAAWATNSAAPRGAVAQLHGEPRPLERRHAQAHHGPAVPPGAAPQADRRRSSLVLAYWLPERVGYGGADYATSFLLVDPDRLSNPYQMMDTKHLRGGVEIDDDGVPMAAHIRTAEQNDWYNAIEANTWERVPREDEDGWRA